jgi:hypothetical protein
VCRDSYSGLQVAKPEDGICRPPGLEGSDHLKVFTFKKQLRPQLGIKRRIREHRRSDDVRRYSCMSDSNRFERKRLVHDLVWGFPNYTCLLCKFTFVRSMRIKGRRVRAVRRAPRANRAKPTQRATRSSKLDSPRNKAAWWRLWCRSPPWARSAGQT